MEPTTENITAKSQTRCSVIRQVSLHPFASSSPDNKETKKPCKRQSNETHAKHIQPRFCPHLRLFPLLFPLHKVPITFLFLSIPHSFPSTLQRPLQNYQTVPSVQVHPIHNIFVSRLLPPNSIPGAFFTTFEPSNSIIPLMNLKTTTLPSLLLLLLLFQNFHFALAGKRRVHITDDLDDVFDDEEDDAWRDWGKKRTPSFPPSDISKMDPSQIQAEMNKRHTGPVIGFVKLLLGVRRTPDMVAEIAMKWTQVLRTGAVGVRFMAVDLSTVMFNMESIKDLEELKEFVLDQSEAYEIKMGDEVFRRPGDPPLDEVIQRLNSEKSKADNADPEEIDGNLKTEL